MKIDCYMAQGCASEEALRGNIALALEAEEINAEIGFHRVSDGEMAELRLSGSPSVFIDGKELQPLGNAGFS